MSVFTPLSETQFQQLAMGKARGFTWTMLADQLSLSLEVVERVPWTHEKQWHRTLAKAERFVAREAIAETASTLRGDLRNAEPQLHATLANSLTRLLQLQQDFAPPKRFRRMRPVAPVAVPEVVQPVAPPKPPADVPPPTPKMTTEEILALKKRIRDRIAAATCAFIAFVCLCALMFGRALPTCSPATLGPVVAHTNFVTANTPPMAATIPADLAASRLFVRCTSEGFALESRAHASG